MTRISVRRLCQAGAIWLAFLAAHALAQPSYAPVRVDVVEDVARRCPGLVLRDHAFTDAVASVLHAQDARWGRNGKRGNPSDPSHDAIAYRTPASPFGVAVIDIIGAAGSPAATPAWIDQTDATVAAGTVGVWIAPSGVLPACLSSVTPPPPPDDRLDDVLVALSRIEARLTALETREDHRHGDLARITDYVDAMIGDGPGGGESPLPNHVTDLKMRLDVIRVQLEQLTAWLRSRGVLRW